MNTSLRQPRHNLLDWSDAHALGLHEIDAQHQWLFSLTNDLWHHLVRRSARQDVLVTLTALERIALSHFATEETFMRVTTYPSLQAHMAEHAEFIDRITREIARVKSGHALSFDLLTYLKGWLSEHILRADKDFARLAHAAHSAHQPHPDEAPAPSLWQRLLARF